jgi:hypothetical protein
MIDTETVVRLWIVTLIVYGVVLVVVAALLMLILRAARDVRDGVSAIWTTGQRVANNTIQIALLDTTNSIAGEILRSAGGVAHATAVLKAHAEDCRGCPACALGGGMAR